LEKLIHIPLLIICHGILLLFAPRGVQLSAVDSRINHCCKKIRKPLKNPTMRNHLSFLVVAASMALAPLAARADIHYTDNINLTTDPNSSGTGDGTGVWFNPLTGYSESRGYFYPSPFFTDGQYWLMMNASFIQTEAQIYTQGFFSRGNGVIYQSSSNLNPAYFGDGTVIGSSSGYQNPGDGYTDLGPTFGNWTAGEHGFLGLTIRDPNGASSSNIFYGYAEITVNADYSITLLSMAYNDVEGASITTVSTVPEPSVLGISGMALVIGIMVRRQRQGTSKIKA
jgi:hypothetical protein